MLIGHGLCTLAVLLYATSFWLIIAVEIFWISLWVLCLFGIMLWTKQPISFGHWFMGNWASCNERDMILDIVRAWNWWDNLLEADKLTLWTAIPDWKWELYDYCIAQKEHLVAERIAEWMQLEPHAYWHMASSMHAKDVPMTIQVFLQARDCADELEVYSMPL